jgi:four helix bundle protein
MKHNFKNLQTWKRARVLVKQVYVITQKFPDEEKYGLISQMRRAAVSIPSNISEGCGRKTTKDFSHFLDIAIGSTCELETQFYLSCDLEYISEDYMTRFATEISTIRRMIIAFQSKLS